MIRFGLGLKMRFIAISMVLCDLLSELVSNDYSWKNTFSFVFQIKNANLSGNFHVSYYVTSLYHLPTSVASKSI